MINTTDKIKTKDLKRVLPEWAEVKKTINTVDIYNMSLVDNIFSWTKNIPDVVAIDYFGTEITYGQLPELVRQYANGFKAIGIKPGDVVTMCHAVSAENILSLLAMNALGAISNNPNFLFLRHDFKRYTLDKKSKTLVILDYYLPFVVDDLVEAGIETVVITNLKDYLPVINKHIFDDVSKLPKSLKKVFCDYEKQAHCQKKIQELTQVKFYQLKDILEIGAKMPDELPSGPVDIERDISYSYTSGTTTGKPKCIVYKELSANALIELHIGIDTKDYVGERVLQVIPYTHVTGERFCGYLQMAKGKTICPQPIYNKDSFGLDIIMSRCNWVTAAPSFYLAGVKQGLIAPDAFANLQRPCAGGEAITLANVRQIDKWLKMNGCPKRLSIGGGASEDGSSTLTAYTIDEETKTNETGTPIEPGIIARVVDDNGVEVPCETRGQLEISSAAAADRYLDNPEATAKRWYVDENGTRWGRTGDMAVKHHNGTYTILGRLDDSCTDEYGDTVYLFDIENQITEDDPMYEWEISYITDGEGINHIVAQVVLKDEFMHHKARAIRRICGEYAVEAIKIFDKFGSSEVTGKRDIQKLKAYRIGYYGYKKGELVKIDFVNDHPPIITQIDEDEIKIEEF